MKFKKTLIALCIGALAVFGLSSAALASGSDGYPNPYPTNTAPPTTSPPETPEEPPAEKDVDVDTTIVCVEPRDGTAVKTVTKSPWIRGFKWVDGKWVPADKSYYDESTEESIIPSEDCAPPVVTPPAPANPSASLIATCGSASMVLTNPLIGDANQLTASFVVYVDGTFYSAYAVEAGNRFEHTFTFGEDSGNHNIEVFQSGTSEWKNIAEALVTSDCEQPPVVIPPTEPPVTTPPVVTPPVTTPTEEPPVEIAETDTSLATTGLNGGETALLITSGLIVAGIGITLYVRGRKAKQ